MSTVPGTYDGLLSLVTLPDGKTYEIEDYYARQLAQGGLSFAVSKNAATTPQGVQWDDDGTTITGTLPPSANTKNIIYLVPQQNAAGKDIFAEYTTIEDPAGTYYWEKLGDTDISSVVWTPVTDNVLGENTTFSGAVTSGSVTVTPANTAYTKSAAVTAVNSDDDTFVKSYPGVTTNLVTDSVTPVGGTTSVTPVGGTATVSQVNIDTASVNTTYLASDPAAVSTWAFACDPITSGSDEYELKITGANGAAITRTNGTASKVSAGTDVTVATAGTAVTVATAGTAKTVVTGLGASGTGGTVMTGLGTPTTASAVTSVTPTTSAANFMVTSAAAGNFVSGITSAALDSTAVTITVGTNDIVEVLTSDTTLVVA